MHAAFNITTCEVITCSTGNGLKRRVAAVERWNNIHGYGRGEWVFAHGNKWGDILGAKYSKRLETKGPSAI